MTAVNPPKVIVLDQLQRELIAAGVTVRGLSTTGRARPGNLEALTENIVTHDAAGVPIDLPPEADAVIAAHVPQPTEVQASTGDLATNVQTALARLDQIIGASTATQAQLLAAVQDLARIERRLLRYVATTLPPQP